MEDVIIDIFRTLYHGHAVFVEKANSNPDKQLTNVEDLIKQARKFKSLCNILMQESPLECFFHYN